MKKVLLHEYGLDLQYEFRTYKYIGRDYGNSKILNRGVINNLIRFLRKEFYNPTENRYKFCNTYSEWLEHIKEIIPKEISNTDDFCHYLIFQMRSAEMYLQAVKAILIPIYITIFSMTNIFRIDNILSAIGAIFVIVAASCFIVFNSIQKVEFYKDLIEVIKDEFNIQNEKTSE